MKIALVEPMIMSAGAPTATSWADAAGGGMSAGGSRHWCFVRVTTDDGLTGIGEASGWPRLAHAAIADLAPLVIGQDPRDIDRLWHRMFTAQMGHGQTGVPAAGAIGAIDMALWDLKAKWLGVPLWQLLGGSFRNRVRAYAHASSIDDGRAATAAGYDAVKTGHVVHAVDKARALRSALGPEVDIAIDLHGPPWLSAPDAIRRIDALAEIEPLFVEDPVAPEDVDGLARVRAAAKVPLAAGERLALLWGYRRLIGDGLVDIVQPDPGRVGGLTQLRKIAAFAEAHFISLAPHAGTLGPVAEYAVIHLLAAIPNALIHERFLADWEGRNRVISQPLEMDGGDVVVPDRPGLGIDLVDDEIAAQPSGRNLPSDLDRYTSSYENGTVGEAVYMQPRRRRGRANAGGPVGGGQNGAKA